LGHQADARLKSAQAMEIEQRLGRYVTEASAYRSYGGRVDALRSVERRLRRSRRVTQLVIETTETFDDREGLG
jgi:hypothetical protein